MEVTTNNYDITNKNLIAHLRFVAIIFQRPVSASCAESRLKFSFLLSVKNYSKDLFTIIFTSSIIHLVYPQNFA